MLKMLSKLTYFCELYCNKDMQQKAKFSFIPNTITSLNVFSGCIAITFAFKGELELAAYFIFISAIFDFFDGFTARLLNAYSQMGKELDSLADVVSFGVAPATIVYQIILQQIDQYNLPGFLESYLPMLSFLIVIFSALRLAKFNIDERQHLTFIGLATPPNAIFFASLIFLSKKDSLISIYEYSQNVWLLLALVLVFSLLLVAEIPMFSLKLKSKKFSDYKIQYIFLGISLVLLITLQLAAISFIILVYILLSIINNIKLNNKQ